MQVVGDNILYRLVKRIEGVFGDSVLYRSLLGLASGGSTRFEFHGRNSDSAFSEWSTTRVRTVVDTFTRECLAPESLSD